MRSGHGFMVTWQRSCAIWILPLWWSGASPIMSTSCSTWESQPDASRGRAAVCAATGRAPSKEVVPGGVSGVPPALRDRLRRAIRLGLMGDPVWPKASVTVAWGETPGKLKVLRVLAEGHIHVPGDDKVSMAFGQTEKQRTKVSGAFYINERLSR